MPVLASVGFTGCAWTATWAIACDDGSPNVRRSGCRACVAWPARSVLLQAAVGCRRRMTTRPWAAVFTSSCC